MSHPITIELNDGIVNKGSTVLNNNNANETRK